MIETAAALKAMALRVMAGLLRLDPSDPKVSAACAMSPEERSTLLPWAPYLAAKVPEWVGDVSDSGAYLFLGLYAVGIWNGSAELRAYARSKENVIEVQAGIGQASIPKVKTVPGSSAASSRDWPEGSAEG